METMFLVYIEYSNGCEPYIHLKEYAFCSNKTDALEIKWLLDKLTNKQAHELKLIDEDDDFKKAHVVPRAIDNYENIIKKLNQALIK